MLCPASKRGAQEIRREGSAGLGPGCYNAQPSKTPEAGRSLAHQFPSTSFLRGRGCLCPPRVKAQRSAAGKPGRCRNPGSPRLSLTTGLEREVSGTCPKRRGDKRRESERGGWAQRPSPGVSRGRAEPSGLQTIPQPCRGHIRGPKTGDPWEMGVSLCAREDRQLDLFGNGS